MYEKIKKRNGERFAKQIRAYDSGIFDIPDVDKIVCHAGRNAEPLMQYLISRKNIEITEKADGPTDPFTLLAQAGYDAFVADTLEKQNSIRKYFASGEALCTFTDERRHQNYHIVHAIRKDVDRIRREAFPHPRREDDYGTSVMSIQIAKGGGFISIKNRYNHAVANPDNTHGSNPDNIIEGLSSALKTAFNVDFSSRTSQLPDGFVLEGMRIVKQNCEVNGETFGDDVYTQNGRLIEVDKGKGEWLFDYYLYSDRTKAMTRLGNEHDSFAVDFNRTYGGRKTLRIKDHCLYDGDVMLIGVKDNSSVITSLNWPELTAAGDSFFYRNTSATELSFSALTTAGDYFCSRNTSATELSFPVLTMAGDDFLRQNTSATELSFPALTTAGDCFCYENTSATELNFPTLTTAVGSFCYRNTSATELSFPALTTAGYSFLRQNTSATELSFPVLTMAGDDFLRQNTSATELSFPMLTMAGDSFLRQNTSATELNFPALITTGSTFLAENKHKARGNSSNMRPRAPALA